MSRALLQRLSRLEGASERNRRRPRVSAVPLTFDPVTGEPLPLEDENEPYRELTVEQWKARYCHDSTLH
jgi:hypothetical protein